MRNVGLLTAAVFSAMMASGGARAIETDLYDFQGGNDGYEPIGRAVVYNGALYGVTFHGGGSCNCGTIYQLDLLSLKETVLYAFGSTQGTLSTGLVQVGSKLYGGTSNGTIYVFDTATNTFSTLVTFPDAGLILGLLAVKTTLYAVEHSPGTKIYQINTKTAHTKLVTTVNGTVNDGPILNAGLLVVPVSTGPDLPNGGVVTIDPNTGTQNTLYAFTGGNDAANPTASLVANAGVLYGTSFNGGLNGEGTIYAVNATSGAESVWHSFSGNPDGSYPDASLIVHNNTLWGVTFDGGTNGSAPPSGGTVFFDNLGTGVEGVAYSFVSARYQYNSPEAALVFYKNAFYGTTTAGGAHGDGSIFKVIAR